MEKVQGETLDKIFEKKPLPWNWKDSIDMLFRIASSLKYLEMRFIHRDLHPLNIIVQKDVEFSPNDAIYSNSGIKVLDFGCTKDTLNSYFGNWSDDAFRVPGAVSSWSPELLLNPNKVNYKHNSWALGVLFYSLLTNKYPYSADNIGGILNYKENLASTFKILGEVLFKSKNTIKYCGVKCFIFSKNKLGVLNQKGIIVLPPIYDDIGDQTMGRFPVLIIL